MDHSFSALSLYVEKTFKPQLEGETLKCIKEEFMEKIPTEIVHLTKDFVRLS